MSLRSKGSSRPWGEPAAGPAGAAGGCWGVFVRACADCGLRADWLLEVPGTAMELKSIRGRPREDSRERPCQWWWAFSHSETGHILILIHVPPTFQTMPNTFTFRWANSFVVFFFLSIRQQLLPGREGWAGGRLSACLSTNTSPSFRP